MLLGPPGALRRSYSSFSHLRSLVVSVPSAISITSSEIISNFLLSVSINIVIIGSIVSDYWSVLIVVVLSLA